MTELLPCPFCGGIDLTPDFEEPPNIHCFSCGGGASLPAWNTRAQPQPIDVEELKREVCAKVQDAKWLPSNQIRVDDTRRGMVAAIDHLAAHYNITKKGE